MMSFMKPESKRCSSKSISNHRENFQCKEPFQTFENIKEPDQIANSVNKSFHWLKKVRVTIGNGFLVDHKEGGNVSF